MPRPYSYHVAEQLAREQPTVSVDTTAVEDSIAARYLSSAKRGEVERAQEVARRIRAGTETQAVVEVLKEQRGSNVDVLVMLAAQGGSYLVGKAVGNASPHMALTAAPAVLGLLASMLTPAHITVRSGIAGATAAYLAGAASSKGKG